VIYAEQRREVDGGADLLQAFAYRRISRMLIVVDESAGEAP